MGDLPKTQKAKIDRGLEKIISSRTDQMADRLTENSYYAYSEGDKAAQKAMNLHLTVKIVQKEATQYMKEYGSLIKKEGNIMIPVYKKMADGADELTGYTKYNLMGHSASKDKKQILDIIKKEYQKGTPTGLKQAKKGTYPKDSIASKLHDHFKMQKSHAALVARTEAQRITDHGQRIRYQKLGVTQARWKTSGDDRVRDQHTIRQEHGIYEMDKIPSLGEPNCRCSIVPVLDTENPLPPETKPPTKKQESKSVLTPKKVAPEKDLVIERLKDNKKIDTIKTDLLTDERIDELDYFNPNDKTPYLYNRIDLDFDQEDAFFLYKGQDYSQINSMLRGMDMSYLSEKRREEVKETIKQMDLGYKSDATICREPIQVFRGIDSETAEKAIKSGAYTDEGYTSTSLSFRRPLRGFATNYDGGYKNVISAVIPKGKRIVSFVDEDEILISRGVEMKLTMVEEFESSKVRILHMVIE